MPYTAQINRTNPACVLLLVDQSRSMDQPLAGTGTRSKAAVVADAVNRLVQNLVLRSAKAGGVRDYFHVGVIGYGREVRSGLRGQLPSAPLARISQLSDEPIRVETRTRLTPDGAGGARTKTVKFPIWYEPEAAGPTPMCAALDAAASAARKFAAAFPNAFPPVVLNLTGGQPTGGDPAGKAWLVRMVSTNDGNALLFNVLLSVSPLPPAYFPDTEDRLPDPFDQALFRMSSVLPAKMREAARAEGLAVREKARGVVVNADPTALVRFLDIGTRVTPGGGRRDRRPAPRPRAVPVNWPLPQDFNEAVQNPAAVFSDPDLRDGATAAGPHGLPLPHSGNYADVYRVRGPDGTGRSSASPARCPGWPTGTPGWPRR